MTEQPKVVDIGGCIEEKEIKEDKNNNKFAKLKIDGTSWNWHYSRDTNKDKIQELVDNLHKGDKVKGLGEETQGTWDGQPTTYHNIKNLEKDETKTEKVSDETKQKNEEDAAIEVSNEVMKKVKVITADSVKEFEEQINLFNREHKVFATQTSFQMIEGLQKFMAVIYFEE